MEPFDRMIQRAGQTLANLHATRSEAVLKIEDVETIRECEQSARWMGMTLKDFRWQVVVKIGIEYRLDITSEWHQLHELLRKTLDEPHAT